MPTCPNVDTQYSHWMCLHQYEEDGNPKTAKEDCAQMTGFEAAGWVSPRRLRLAHAMGNDQTSDEAACAAMLQQCEVEASSNASRYYDNGGT